MISAIPSSFVDVSYAAEPTTTISITTANGATVCPGSLKGAWDSSTDTCSITAVGSITLSEEGWAALAEFLHFFFDMALDPEYAIYIPQGTTLNVGTGVFISAMSEASSSTDEVYAIINEGTINNNGSIIGLSSGNGAALNSGTINNRGYLQLGATNTNIGIFNSGIINNGWAGYLRGYSDLYGIINSGIINNNAILEGDGGSIWLGDTADHWSRHIQRWRYH